MACAGNVILSHSIYGLKERLQGTSASGAVPYSRRSIPAYMTIVALISIEVYWFIVNWNIPSHSLV